MSDAWKQWEGHVVNGQFPLREFQGNTDHSAVFVTHYGAMQEKAAIKFIPAAASTEEKIQNRWQRVSKLTHPHLLRLFAWGKCNLSGTPFLYVVSEFAEENLAQILPHRPLTPQETEFMLRSSLEVLGTLHSSGLAHAGIKPSNLMAVGDNLKLCSESICDAGDRGAAPPSPTVYDAPELNATGPSAAADIWSLGVTLVEALTQKVSPGEALREGEAVLPDGMPGTFFEIARQCLRLDPQRRWTTQEIAARLVPSPPMKKPRPAFVPAALAVAALGVILAAGKILWRSGEPKARTDTVAASPAAPAPPIRPEPPRENSPKSTPSSGIANSSPRDPAPVSKSHNPMSRGTARGAVLERVVPSVSKRSRDTITGKVRVAVKLNVDPSGRVTGASLSSPGPSQYFAKVALEAARKWKFTPPTRDGENLASNWVLHFAFGRAGVDIQPAQVSP